MADRRCARSVQISLPNAPNPILSAKIYAVRGIPVAAEAEKLVRLYGTVAAANTKMIKWNKFLGFIEEGRLRDHLLMDGTFQDAVFLGLLEPDYREITVPRLRILVGMGL